ncbi:hypothetical protein NKH94_29305 [Mesorhizobium australicum]|uniref:IS66 family insertion sequence element accessory protein TnpA n=1 Tax=Mesorhizobium australicum TaxID=536018 RepID=UPI00333A2991
MNEKRQSYWVVHVEAWRRSGLTRTEYCRVHRLTKDTLDRRLKYFASNDAARKHAEYQAELRRQRRLEERAKRQKKRARLLCGEHGCAQPCCPGVLGDACRGDELERHGHPEYAAALHLSPTSLRTGRDRLDEGEVEIDWRAHLQPSVRPVVSIVLAERRRNRA